MLDIPEEMKPFVNDYKMMLVEARESKLILHNMNNVYFFRLLEILLDKSRPLNETRNRVIDYAREHNVDKNVIMTVCPIRKNQGIRLVLADWKLAKKMYKLLKVGIGDGAWSNSVDSPIFYSGHGKLEVVQSNS